jgi:hypothetical protein
MTATSRPKTTLILAAAAVLLEQPSVVVSLLGTWENGPQIDHSNLVNRRERTRTNATKNADFF